MSKELLGSLELNRVYQMDFLDGFKMIHNESIDIIVTDPPYGIDYQSNWGRGDSKIKLNKIKNDDNITKWFERFSNECYRVLKDNSALYCFTRFDVYPYMYDRLKGSGFNIKNLLVVQKGQKGGNGDLQAQYSNDCELLIYANKGRRKFNQTKLAKTDGRKGASEYRTRLPNVWFDTEYNKFPKSTVNVSNQHGDIIHPTEKNVELIDWLLQISSNENDIVLDPFMGSGTTAVSCLKNKRKFLGFEIESKYIELINKRIESTYDQLEDEKLLNT